MMETIKYLFDDKNLKQHKSLAIGLVAVILLFAAILFSGSRVVMNYRQASANRAEEAHMQETIRDWQTKAEFVNGQTYRPVPADRIEAVQGDLMQAMQTYSLTLVDYKPLKGPVKAATKKKTNTSAKDGDKNKKDAPAPADYKAFSMSFTGSYENIMKYIGNFHSRDALISLDYIEIADGKDGLIKATVNYRIYTK